jgi:ubiquinone/menaquinone biosynthesis C-methylase UbiE
MRTFSREEARSVYNRIGARQDSQAFYEDHAANLIIQHGELATARHVFEFGCGTGRFALRLLLEHLGPETTYRAIDISPTMVGLAQDKLAPFSPRAEVVLTDGAPPEQEAPESYDRFLSTYVFDLLSEEDISGVLGEAHRILQPGGLLCLSSLTSGSSPGARLVAGLWSALHRLSPRLVAGCRPLELLGRLSASEWKVRHHLQIAPFALPSEVVIAERL